MFDNIYRRYNGSERPRYPYPHGDGPSAGEMVIVDHETNIDQFMHIIGLGMAA